MIRISKIVIKHCIVNVANNELLEKLRQVISSQWAGATVEFFYDKPPVGENDEYNE